jgi:hypothetical protein
MVALPELGQSFGDTRDEGLDVEQTASRAIHLSRELCHIPQ